MRKHLLFAFIALLSTLYAQAYDFKSGDLYYNIKWWDDGNVEVASPNSMENNYSELTSVVIPDSVTYEGNTYRVTGIGYMSFRNCKNLTSVTMSNSITTIGSYAFENCTGLTSLTIPNSVTSIGGWAFLYVPNIVYYGSATDDWFWGARNVNGYVDGYFVYEDATKTDLLACSSAATGTITIPNSVTSIWTRTFYGCTGITAITIPTGVSLIGVYAFSDCPNLTSIIVENGNTHYDSRDNCNAIIETATNTLIAGCKNSIIPNGVTSIGMYAFKGRTGLTSITIPSSVTSIGEEAFYACTNLTSITIPNGVTSIEQGAFANCSRLASVTIPNGVTSIEPSTFADCSRLASITIPNGVTSIGKQAFQSCGLNTITIPNGVTNIGSEAFYNCEKLASITIPNSVTVVGDNAFTGTPWYTNQPDGVFYMGSILYKYKGNMPQGTHIIVKDGTTSISGGAFSGCKGLSSIIIPNSVTTIGEKAFFDCTNLTSITIPSSVTTIGYRAFFYCTGLTSITIPNSVTTIEEYAFEGVFNIIYSGTATGAPWGANYMNAYIEDNLIYSDATKTNLLDCNSVATGNITIPNSVTTIGRRAFLNCENLTSITIPNSVTTIGDSAFFYCIGLTSITMPSRLTSIGFDAFESCYGLTSIVWNAKNYANFDDEDFSDADYILSPFYNIADQITSFVFGDSVQHIPASLCRNLYNLTTISIPNSVTSIGRMAFFNCDNLTSITIPNSVTTVGKLAFADTPWYWNQPDGVIYIGRSLYDYKGDMPQGTNIVVKEGTTSIGSEAFYYCTGLSSITIPSSVTTIGESAFRYCSGLTSVTIPNSVTTIGESAFSSCSGLTSVAIPNSVTTIGESVFSYCSGLTSVTIPNSVTAIGKEAFNYCTKLNSVTIPNSVTTIGEDAFKRVFNIMYTGTAIGAPWGAKHMNAYEDGHLIYADSTKTILLSCSREAKDSIIIPSSVTTIDESAFEECRGLTSITIPNSVTSIGNLAFSGCSGITSINIPSSVTSIGYGAFMECQSLKSIIIPNSVTSMGEGTFMDCENLTSITIPNGITTIGEGTFGYCTSLTSINIPNSVTSMGYGAFMGCQNLKSITIPGGVTTIGEGAFAECTRLKSITCQAIEPPAVDSGYYTHPFDEVDISSIPLYVPAESITKYNTAEVWKDFKNIKPIGATPMETDKPILNPEENKVTITWPAADNAATYTIEIRKAGTLICTLTFDANGVLQNMRFAAPSRHAAQHTAQAEATNNGFRFVVEGLDYATTYAYSITSTDKDEKVLTTYSGTFTTTSPGTTTDADNLRATQSDPATRKVFRNGQLLILRGDKAYTTDGRQL